MCSVFRNCEVISAVPLCAPLGYPNTTFPNARGHRTQIEANEELTSFKLLIDIGCSPFLRHFLCAFYIPFCKNILPPDMNVPPCRRLCEHVREKCEWVMRHYGAEWPTYLSCEQFPVKEDVPWCFGPDDPTQLTGISFVHNATASLQRTTPPLHEMSTTFSSSELASSPGTYATDQPLPSSATETLPVSMATNEGSGEENSGLQFARTFASEFDVGVSGTPRTSSVQSLEGSRFFPGLCTTMHTCSQTTNVESTSTQQELSVVPTTPREPLEASSQETQTSTMLITPTRVERESIRGATTAETTPNTATLPNTNTDPVISFTYLFIDTLPTTLATSSQHPFLQHNTSPSTSLASTQPLTLANSFLPTTSSQAAMEGKTSLYTPFPPITEQPTSDTPLSKISTEAVTLPTLSYLTSSQSQPISTPPPPHTDSRPCTPLNSNSLCHHFGYTAISLPNNRGHKNQQKAEEELALFSFFVKLNCSLLMEQFLCLYYLPPCSPVLPSIQLPPCKELCQQVREDCIVKLNRVALQWPHHMDCAHLPSHANHSCTMEDLTDILKSPASTMNQGGTVQSKAHLDITISALIASVLIIKLCY